MDSNDLGKPQQFGYVVYKAYGLSLRQALFHRYSFPWQMPQIFVSQISWTLHWNISITFKTHSPGLWYSRSSNLTLTHIALPQRPSEKLRPKPPWTHHLCFAWLRNQQHVDTIMSCQVKMQPGLISQTSSELCVPFLVSLVKYLHSYKFYIRICWKLSFLELSFYINFHGYSLRVLVKVLPSKWFYYSPKAKSMSSI